MNKMWRRASALIGAFSLSACGLAALGPPAPNFCKAENRRIPALDDRPETVSADEVMWHVMQHEVRHTAQIVQMIRTLGYEPPSLDLVFLTMR